MVLPIKDETLCSEIVQNKQTEHDKAIFSVFTEKLKKILAKREKNPLTTRGFSCILAQVREEKNPRSMR